MLSDEEILEITGGSKDWTLRPAGGGFQGSHYHLECGGRRWFVKAQPEHKVFDYYEKLGAFIKEPLVYSTLLPEVRQHLKPDIKIWPDIYLARKGAMVLEDLSEAGWSLAENLDREHIEVVLKALANLHGASMCLDFKNPLLQKYPDVLKETYFGDTPDHPGLQTWTSFTSTAAKICNSYFPDRNLEGAISLMNSVPQMVKPSLGHRNCLCHGDLWQNNIFFKHRHGRPVASIFVDFAQVRYCPPALDVLLFLHHLQVQDIEAYLLHYQAELQKIVPDFSLDELYASFSVAEPFALCVAPLYIYLTRLPEKALREVARSQEEFWEFATGKDAPAMEALAEDAHYRTPLLEAFKQLLDYSENLKCNKS